MARPLRVEFAGAMYHVTVRGVERRNLFRNDGDRERLLEKLSEGVERYDLDIFLYCLMSNHIHLLVGTPQGNLGRFMGWWLTAYTVFFNRKYGRSGHLTQGRYGAKLVGGDAYLLKLSRYIHLNPVQTRGLKRRSLQERLEALREYPWSSFRGYGWAGCEQPFVQYQPLRELVGEGKKNLRLAYRSFVERGIDVAAQEWQTLQRASRIAIGSDAFIEDMETLYGELVEGRSSQEDIALRRMGRRADPDAVLGHVAEVCAVPIEELRRCRRNAWGRAIAARCLVQYSGLTQREAAVVLNLRTGAAVSMQLRKLSTALRVHGDLAQTLRNIEQRLQAT